MKSIKLASGFAVSALALAIAGQAAADTTFDVDFSADLKVNTTLDFENERRMHGLPGYHSADDDWYNFTATWSVSNGPFSGDIIAGVDEDEEHNGIELVEGEAGIWVDNLRVDEGPFSFGQIGRITDTAGLYEDLTDENEMFGEDDETRIGVDAAFRYSVDDLGLRVQAEGNAGHPFGFAAALNQDLDVAEVWADVQYREALDAPDGMQDAEFTFGLGTVATPVDMVTLTAVYRQISNDVVTTAGAGDDDRGVFAVKADVQATDELSVFLLLTDRDALESDSDTLLVRGGAVAEFAPFTVEGGYEALAAEIDAGFVFAKLSYAEGPYGAFAEVNYGLEGFTDSGYNENQDADLKLVLGGDYTFDSGVVFGAEYTNQGDDYFDGGVKNEVEMFAKYSF
ncbi:hypothetical protein E4656_14275 [Natronospirillum operosum]|uniref:Porin n=1 Tax=Natronospirillum operosum TaxID=2759953 RepID=A0A4Z0W9P2_9GAMM|nr:hypothetical protein [Natronospirillum operosum]TGG92043.1 hypothetical protein E4656_14275 [Natronospirillum operosum]